MKDDQPPRRIGKTARLPARQGGHRQGKKKSPEADTRALLEYIVPRLEVLETTFFRR
ncbi:MAG TPA: hypothetical protein PKZ26_08915 [Anaerolineaceae bacterium]|nr:hypothetical protein [Chloroflexota bacterium]HNS07170.1 hypothetical protein [Anaerolineaceae bacterium]HNW14180.1 hypothetical protein [Anaerolineaceae bacterium]HOQ68785.1 hypothetical protein [Anaerolineaceae bacterium]HPD62602.1 hypothetical protein [Anaerolineaceae bacterium]